MIKTPDEWTVRRLLEWTSGFFTRKQVDAPRLSAELLLAHVMKMPRLKLYLDYERVVGEAELKAYRALVQRAGEHEPVAYLTGKAHFFNLELDVTRDVLIPRPDTEVLVENVLQLVRNQPGLESPRVLDLCTGSGCVAAAIAFHLKHAIVVATDISAAAVAVAKKNIENLKLADRVTVEQGDLFEPVARLPDPRPFDLIVANPPYIPTAQVPQLPRNVRDYEPLGALDGGLDGLALHRHILHQAPEKLVPGGRIFLEIAFDQGDLARQIAADYPAFEDVKVLKDYTGNERVLTARRK
jgi:release factor glutamine methyltransferase